MATETKSFVAGLGDELAQMALNLLEGMREAEGVEFSTRVLEIDEIAREGEIALVSKVDALIGNFPGRRIRIPPEKRVNRGELPVGVANCTVVFVRENGGQGSLKDAVRGMAATLNALPPEKNVPRKRRVRERRPPLFPRAW